MKTTIGQIMINEALPAELRDYSRVLDKKGVKELFTRLAEKHPDQYTEVAKNLMDIGRDFATQTNGYSFGLDALEKTAAATKAEYELEQKLAKIYTDRRIPEKQRYAKALELMQEKLAKLPAEVMDEALKTGNPIARQVLSGAKGNRMNLNALIGADLIYSDSEDKPVPFPILRNYSQGFRPYEYFAGSYGARKGVLDTKLATMDAGYLLKQLTQMNHRLLVTAQDDDTPYDSDNPRGYPVDTDDADNAGALLAHPVGEYARNTVLTPKILKSLKASGFNKILVRSPIVGGPEDGGVFGRDVGLRERGQIAPVGDFVGIAAAQALGERLTQGALCLAKGTLVRMADMSVKPIEQVRVGDVVLGADCTGATFPVRVLNTYNNGLRDCYRYDFSFQYQASTVSVTCTAEHKILGTRVTTGQLSDADNWTLKVQPIGGAGSNFYAAAPLNMGYTCDAAAVSNPYLELLGLLVADGCYTKSLGGAVNLSCADPTLVEHINSTLKTHDIQLVFHKGSQCYWRVKYTADSAAQDPVTGRMLPGARSPIKKLMDSMGMRYRYSYEKDIPQAIARAPLPDLTMFLQGLFAGDGTVYAGHQRKPHIGYASTSLTLIEQLKDILALRYAIYVGAIHKNQKGRQRPLYSFIITHTEQVLRFNNCFNIPGIKGAYLKQLLAAWLDVVTIRYPYYFKRRAAVSVGKLPTYDIEVDHSDHLFVLANGLIVSNSSKHSGGAATATSKAISGFSRVNSLIQVPKNFPDEATHATVDGKVDRLEPAPQGGQYLYIGSERHYVLPNHNLLVKPGDVVDAGDALTDGMPNPAMIVKHKGVGEGRRYFTDIFRQTMVDSGIPANRRNVELLSRGLINYVRLQDPYQDWVPDDIVPYHVIERRYKPRPGYQTLTPTAATGKYLERPVLHYSIGTKLQPKMVKQLQDFGVKQVFAHNDRPIFEPEMIRGATNVTNDPDWMTRMLGAYQEKSLLRGVHRGDVSDISGSSYVPALAKGLTFGEEGATKAWKPAPDMTNPAK